MIGTKTAGGAAPPSQRKAGMKLSGKRVQVAKPTPENSLAQGVVATAWWLGFMVPEWYVLAPENPDDQETVKSLLFIEAELEELP